MSPGKRPTKGELEKMDILPLKEKSDKLSQKSLDAFVLQMIERDYSDSAKPEVRAHTLDVRSIALCIESPSYTCVLSRLSRKEMN